MENNSTILIIVIIIFQIFIIWGFITSIIKIIKSIKYKSIKALVIDNVILGSEQWGKYFPDEYKLTYSMGSKLNAFSNFADSATQSSRKNIKYEELNETYTMIAEYTVENKKYYYYEKFINESSSKNPFKKMVGKELDIKYDPNNPKKNIRVKSNIKGVLLLFGMEIILLLIYKFIIK